MSIYGLRLHPLTPTSYYSAPETCRKGQHVIVNTSQGSVIAPILSGPLTALPGVGENELPAIERIASDEDLAAHARNQVLAKESASFCKACIKQRGLDMKLVDVEVFFDKSKLIFYFTAPGRIDFRELVKDLVREYRARIELRQIGVRNETQLTGAIGNCGMVCCCRNHLRKFAPVTIRMAKEQNLFLNPGKISGICGRLLCCLSYEQDNYEQFHKIAPRPGRKYNTDKGVLKVQRVCLFKNSVVVADEENEEREIPLSEWQSWRPQRGSEAEAADDDDLPEDVPLD